MHLNTVIFKVTWQHNVRRGIHILLSGTGNTIHKCNHLHTSIYPSSLFDAAHHKEAPVLWTYLPLVRLTWASPHIPCWSQSSYLTSTFLHSSKHAALCHDCCQLFLLFSCPGAVPHLFHCDIFVHLPGSTIPHGQRQQVVHWSHPCSIPLDEGMAAGPHKVLHIICQRSSSSTSSTAQPHHLLPPRLSYQPLPVITSILRQVKSVVPTSAALSSWHHTPSSILLACNSVVEDDPLWSQPSLPWPPLPLHSRLNSISTPTTSPQINNPASRQFIVQHHVDQSSPK